MGWSEFIDDKMHKPTYIGKLLDRTLCQIKFLEKISEISKESLNLVDFNQGGIK